MPSYSIEMRLSRTFCSMPCSAMKPWPPKICTPWLADSKPTSVMNALAIGVRKASIESAAFFCSSSWLRWTMSTCLAAKYSIARLPSAKAFMVSSMRRTSGCTMIGSAGFSGAFGPVSERICRRSRA